MIPVFVTSCWRE